jgi:hypothetical protein
MVCSPLIFHSKPLLTKIDGHYLNLPVMNDAGEIVGMVDVLKLTYATLEQVNTMSSGDSEGPAWNKFWMHMDDGTESVMSGEGSHHHTHGARSLMSPDHSRAERLVEPSVAPGDSASHVGVDSPSQSVASRAPEIPIEELPFPFKFKTPSGRVHRMQVVAAHGMVSLIAAVTAKIGGEIEAVGGEASFEDGKLGKSGYALSYLDDEGDSVSLTTDQDLLDAILLARQGNRDKVDLFVHDPEKPAYSATVDPHPVIPIPAVSTPPPSTIRERRKPVVDEEQSEESEEEQPVRAKHRRNTSKSEPEQVIAGVPNELLLPGAIVTLAVVIVGVFALTRATSR